MDEQSAPYIDLDQFRNIPEALVQAGSDVHSRFERSGGIDNHFGIHGPAGIAYADHHSPGARRNERPP